MWVRFFPIIPHILSIERYHWLSLIKRLKILQRGVQWKQGVVIYLTWYTSLLYDTTPIHCPPLPLHPPVMSIQQYYISSPPGISVPVPRKTSEAKAAPGRRGGQGSGKCMLLVCFSESYTVAHWLSGAPVGDRGIRLHGLCRAGASADGNN